MKLMRLATGLATLIFLTAAAPAAPTAEEMISQARAEAGTGGKNVFVIFGASWCDGCLQFNKFFAAKPVQAILKKYFVITHLEVMESEAKKALETPGGEKALEKLGGTERGLPFIALVNPQGDVVANCLRPKNEKDDKDRGGNIGFPLFKEDVAWFQTMLRQAAPKITMDELRTLEKELRKIK